MDEWSAFTHPQGPLFSLNSFAAQLASICHVRCAISAPGALTCSRIPIFLTSCSCISCIHINRLRHTARCINERDVYIFPIKTLTYELRATTSSRTILPSYLHEQKDSATLSFLNFSCFLAKKILKNQFLSFLFAYIRKGIPPYHLFLFLLKWLFLTLHYIIYCY